MSWFPTPSSPRAAFRDLTAFIRHSGREQRIGAALAVLITTIIVIVFLVDSKIGVAPTPTPTYVELYPSNRTDAEIIAQQKNEMVIKEQGEKEKRRQFQKLEKRLHLD
jgi:flagellar biosynthesis/type III secretory pathway M-ring protein FliF/YscJ